MGVLATIDFFFGWQLSEPVVATVGGAFVAGSFGLLGWWLGQRAQQRVQERDIAARQEQADRDIAARREMQDRDIAVRRADRLGEWRNERDRDAIEAAANCRRAALALAPDAAVPMMSPSGQDAWVEAVKTGFGRGIDEWTAAAAALDRVIIAHPARKVREAASNVAAALYDARRSTYAYAITVTSDRGRAGPDERKAAVEAASLAVEAAADFREALLAHRDDTT